MKLLMFEYGQFKHAQHAQREITPSLSNRTKDSFAECHTRWRGLESHLLTQYIIPYVQVQHLYKEIVNLFLVLGSNENLKASYWSYWSTFLKLKKNG